MNWKHAPFFSVLKPVKNFRSLSPYRPVSLTSCVEKLLERLALCRLQWFLEGADLLLAELSGFRHGRGNGDCIADLASVLEDSGHRIETAVALFLDIELAFYSVPDIVIFFTLSSSNN